MVKGFTVGKKSRKNNNERQEKPKKHIYSAVEILAAIGVVGIVFYAFRSIFAITVINDLGGVVEFNQIVNDIYIVCRSISLYVSIGALLIIYTSVLYSKKHRYTCKTIIWLIIIGLLAAGVILFRFLSDYNNNESFNDFSNILFLIEIPITLSLLLTISKDNFTPLSFYISIFAIFAISVALFIIYISSNENNSNKYQISIKNFNQKIDQVTRYGDMLFLTINGKDKMIVPVSDFIKATSHDNITDNASKASDNSTPTEKAK